MTIKQLSIFIENKSGTLLQVLNILKDNGISIIVSTLSDTQDFGIYRIICDNAEQACSILREKGINVTISKVFAIRLSENKVGAAADTMALITKDGVDIKYMYSFMLEGTGVLVFRADDDEKAQKTIACHNLQCLSETDLK